MCTSRLSDGAATRPCAGATPCACMGTRFCACVGTTSCAKTGEVRASPAPTPAAMAISRKSLRDTMSTPLSFWNRHNPFTETEYQSAYRHIPIGEEGAARTLVEGSLDERRLRLDEWCEFVRIEGLHRKRRGPRRLKQLRRTGTCERERACDKLLDSKIRAHPKCLWAAAVVIRGAIWFGSLGHPKARSASSAT